MRFIPADLIHGEIVKAIGEITFRADDKLLDVLRVNYSLDQDTAANEILGMILANNEIAPIDQIPICQDTGTTVVFAELGKDVMIQGATLRELIDAAVREAYQKFGLRASMLSDPLYQRKNTQDNTPAILHLSQTDEDVLRLTVAQKGGGAENMSFLSMMYPSASAAEIIEYVVQGVLKAGAKACPPLIVGIGIGGNFETCALLAKSALFEPTGRKHPDPEYASLEHSIWEQINHRGCGVQGMGGNLTAVAVHVKHAPCHIASLPVAVNLQCHLHRHKTIEL